VCDVLIVCRQYNDREWKLKEQRAKMWENIAGAKRYSRPRGFNIAGVSAPQFRRLAYFYSSLGEDARHTGSADGGGAEPME